MTAKVIAVANMKGGVGKTATVVGLAEAFAARGARVLVIDLDAQANASVCIAGDAQLASFMKRKQTIEGFLEDQLLGKKRLKITDCIRNNVSAVTHFGRPLEISVLPSSPELRTFEHRLLHDLTQRNMSWSEIVNGLYAAVEKSLAQVRKSFDYIFVDCAPGISVLTEVSIRLADLVLVPTIPDFLSTYGLQNFCVTLSHRGVARGRRKAQLPHVLITRRRKVLVHERTANDLRIDAAHSQPAFHVFDTEIPEAVKVADALGQLGSDDAFHSRTRNFTNKWGPAITPLLSDLTQEIDEVLLGHRA